MKWYVKDPWVSIPTITPVTAYTLETGFEITGGVDAKTLITVTGIHSGSTRTQLQVQGRYGTISDRGN